MAFMTHHIPGNTKSCSPCFHAVSLVDDQWMDGSIADVHGWPTAPSIGPTILFYAHSGSWASVSMFLHDDSAGSSDEEDWSGGEVEAQDSPRTNEDHELKDKLLRRYSGYISTLKREFTKKKKNGKLPREARQILFDWWNLHYKWPYPTEADKISLAQVTRLDQKQINNWFINQRKRHWKPTENMQYAVMDSLYGPCSTKD